MTANTHVCILQYPLPQNTKVFEVETVSLVTGSRGERWRHLRGEKKRSLAFSISFPSLQLQLPQLILFGNIFREKRIML